MLGRVLAESVPPGSFVSRDGVVALKVVVVLSREGKPHPVCLPASAKLAAQGRSGQPPPRRSLC